MNERGILDLDSLLTVIFLVFSRKQDFGILSFQGDESDLMPFRQFPEEKRGMMGNAAAEGVGQPHQNYLHGLFRKICETEGSAPLLEKKFIISAIRPKKIVWTPIIISKTPRMRRGR